MVVVFILLIMKNMNLITPHWGQLKNLNTKQEINAQYTIKVNKDIETDIYNLGCWIYSPLEWFLNQQDFESVLDNMQLTNNTLWPIPIVLDISWEDKENINKTKPENILITNTEDNPIAYLEPEDIYNYDKSKYAYNIFGTTDENHPGVKDVFEKENFLIGWRIKTIQNNPLAKDPDIWKYYLTPEQTREKFKQNKWEKVVAFQTRNPPHRSHEYLQKCALQGCDGLFINPVIWKKKKGDFKDKYIMGAYEILIDDYYNKNHTHLGILPLTMKYAWPKEAVLHAIIRQNFGCSHMIVGRDHAGVWDYYGSYEAQEIFNKISEDKLEINILKYEHAGYCTKCWELTSNKTCPHPNKDKVLFSGTQIREKMQNKEKIPEEFMRKEVSNYLIQQNDQFVE